MGFFFGMGNVAASARKIGGQARWRWMDAMIPRLWELSREHWP